MVVLFVLVSISGLLFVLSLVWLIRARRQAAALDLLDRYVLPKPADLLKAKYACYLTPEEEHELLTSRWS